MLLRQEFEEKVTRKVRLAGHIIHSEPRLILNDILFYNHMLNNQNRSNIINMKDTCQ